MVYNWTGVITGSSSLLGLNSSYTINFGTGTQPTVRADIRVGGLNEHLDGNLVVYYNSIGKCNVSFDYSSYINGTVSPLPLFNNTVPGTGVGWGNLTIRDIGLTGSVSLMYPVDVVFTACGTPAGIAKLWTFRTSSTSTFGDVLIQGLDLSSPQLYLTATLYGNATSSNLTWTGQINAQTTLLHVTNGFTPAHLLFDYVDGLTGLVVDYSLTANSILAIEGQVTLDTTCAQTSDGLALFTLTNVGADVLSGLVDLSFDYCSRSSPNAHVWSAYGMITNNIRLLIDF
jgi:hypothetical protein